MAEQSKTRYLVLRRVKDDAGEATVEAWAPLGEIDASSRDQARRLFMESDAASKLSEGEHVIRAVPKINWGDTDATEVFVVRTQRTVTSVKSSAAAGGRKEQTHAGAAA